MRRIVIMAMSETGITCAKQIKKASPQDEVNILVSEAGLADFTKSSHTALQGSVLERQGIPFPDLPELTALGLDVIGTKQVQLDIGTQEVSIVTGKGSLSIRYSDLVIEVQASSRLPRPLHNKDNVFPLPTKAFGQNSAAIADVLARAQKSNLPALVVGSGMPAIDAMLLAREAGLHTLWLETPSDTAPTIDRHFKDYIVKLLQPHIVHIPVDTPAMEALEFAISDEQVKMVTLPDGTQHSVGVCIWAETFLTMHPILREDGFILDSSGKMSFTDEKPADIHVIGSGVAQLPATLCNGALTLPPYTGESEAALVSALRVANTLADIANPTTGLYGTTSAAMTDLCVYRTGISEEEATKLNIPVEHATLCLTDSTISGLFVNKGNKGDKVGKLSLNLIAHKEEKTIIGAQVIGENALAPLAHGTLALAFEAMHNETPLDEIVLHEVSGKSAYLVRECADRLQDKLKTSAKGSIYGITPYEFMASLNAGADFFVLDVRPNSEWQKGHVPHAHNIPVMEIKKRLSSEVPRYVPIVVVGKNGTDAFHTAIAIAGMGAKDLYVLDGGMDLWSYPVEKES